MMDGPNRGVPAQELYKSGLLVVCVSWMVERKMVKANGIGSSNQIIESNPVVPIKYSHGTHCLLERLRCVSSGVLPQN